MNTDQLELNNISNQTKHSFLAPTISSAKRKSTKSEQVFENQLTSTDHDIHSRSLVNSRSSFGRVSHSCGYQPRSSLRSLQTIHPRSLHSLFDIDENRRTSLKAPRHTYLSTISRNNRKEANTAPLQKYRHQSSNEKSKTNIAKNTTVPIGNQLYMMDKQDFKEYFSKEETESMRRAHIKHVQNDTETLRYFLQPKTKSQQPYDSTMRHAARARTKAILLRPRTVCNEFTTNSIGKHDATESIDTNDTQEFLNNLTTKLEEKSQRKWNLFVHNYGGDEEEEYMLHKMRKNYEDRNKKLRQQRLIQRKLLENQSHLRRQRKNYMFTPSEEDRIVKRKFLPMYDKNKQKRFTNIGSFVANNAKIAEWNQKTRSNKRCTVMATNSMFHVPNHISHLHSRV